MARIRSEMEEGWFVEPTIGFAEGGGVHHDGGGSAMQDVAAILWVPDPEQRHGWREFYIARRNAEAKPGRPMGFGKPGER